MKYMSKMTAPVVASAFLLTVSGAALADNNTDSGLYSGVGVGQSRVHDADLHAFSNNDSGSTISSDDDTAQNAFVGYKYNPYFSSEAFFTDFGDVDVSGNGTDGKLSTKAYGLSAIGELPIYGGLSAYGRVGYAYFKTNGHGSYGAGNDIDNEYGGAPVYGVGAKYQFEQMPVFVRAEYDRYQLDSNYKLDTAMGSIGVQF
ncbi:outer membrane beta-barrel protein [Larsenimonas rhizosphaerae]|uniref:Outer membrane beta-barrel protein n=1 Tax=Larsenimonas rhizosphaerae TaxID=2944682 RepID=A0AA41ZK20_9GAMM|nr:outer membrane beta-barrel protein [Larsenimonas rhizosphaerae]MCM2130343.1 outer membrane beta-barrel protein [Larsenimonas rhizosphaerae]MCX2523048.1 outer membrane beta-barrel protein [Larsenimonas rhizosphaerae]